MTSSSRRRSRSIDRRRNSGRNRSRSKRRSRSPISSARRSMLRRRSPRRTASPGRRRSSRHRSPTRRRSPPRRRSRSRGGRRGRSVSSSPSLDAKIRQRRAARRTQFQSPPRSMVPDTLTPTPALEAAANATQLANAATAASATIAALPAPIPDGPPEQTKAKPPPPPPPKTIVTERIVESTLGTIASTMGMGQSAPAITAAPPLHMPTVPVPKASTVPKASSPAFDPSAPYDPSAPCDVLAPVEMSAAASANTAVPTGWGFAAKMATRINDRPVVKEDDTSYGTGAARNRANDPFASLYSSKNKSTSSAPKRDIASLDKFRIKKKPATPANNATALCGVPDATAAAAGCGVPAFYPTDVGVNSGAVMAPTFTGAGAGNLTVEQLLMQGAPQFVNFDPENPEASAAAMGSNHLQASGINMALLPVVAPAPTLPPIVVRPKLSPHYTGLERFRLPFPPQKNAVAVINEIGTKCGRFVEFHTVEERDENKSFTEKYDFGQSDQKRWMQWKARFQTTVLHVHAEAVTGDWCSTKSNSVTVAAEKTLSIMYGSNLEQMWIDCTGKSQKPEVKKMGVPPSGGGGNKISEVNEMLQKMFRGQFQGQFMTWKYLPAGKGRMVAQVHVPPLEKTFDGPVQPSKKDAQREAVGVLHKYLTTHYYS
eukprot:GEMP01017190.1.p1 GENE.GEMP01017190.1~~GEMP01017190.1.p1  ORF type:complete len:656 (+),score=179.54 GEMP01017190.1:50-2017(+)